MPLDSPVNKYVFVYSCNGILHINKEWTMVRALAGVNLRTVEWKQPDTKTTFSTILFISSLGQAKQVNIEKSHNSGEVAHWLGKSRGDPIEPTRKCSIFWCWWWFHGNSCRCTITICAFHMLYLNKKAMNKQTQHLSPDEERMGERNIIGATMLSCLRVDVTFPFLL